VADTSNAARYLKAPFRTFFALRVPVLFSLIVEPVTGLVDNDPKTLRQ